jgi:hypothetical protein
MLYPSQRSSWAAAATFPSTMRQAAELPWYALSPRIVMIQETGTSSVWRAGTAPPLKSLAIFRALVFGRDTSILRATARSSQRRSHNGKTRRRRPARVGDVVQI